jgi:enamine deaminase RidA (YjgF/YER057c/UK114 family)
MIERRKMGVDRLNLSGLLGTSPGYAYAATASGSTTVYCAGAVPLDNSGNLVGAGDLESQTRRAIENLRVALDGAGAQAADVVKTTIYVVGKERAHLGDVWRVVAETPFAKAPSTLLGVTYLGYDGQLVEIEAIAVLGDGQ